MQAFDGTEGWKISPFGGRKDPEKMTPDDTKSLIEEAEAIGWYEQRLALEKDLQAHAIMENAQQEEFKHFAMDLEFLLRRTPLWREIAEGILFQEGAPRAGR